MLITKKNLTRKDTLWIAQLDVKDSKPVTRPFLKATEHLRKPRNILERYKTVTGLLLCHILQIRICTRRLYYVILIVKVRHIRCAIAIKRCENLSDLYIYIYNNNNSLMTGQ